MDELLRLIAAALNQKGALQRSDLSLLFDPYVGILSNTYTPPTVIGEGVANPEQYLPTFIQIDQFEDPTSLRRTIAESVKSGLPLWEIEKQINTQLALEDSSGMQRQGQTEDYVALAKTLQNEWRDYSGAAAKAGTEVSKSEFAKAGLPELGAQFDVGARIQPQLDMLARKYQEAVKAKTQQFRGQFSASDTAPAAGYVAPVGTTPAPEKKSDSAAYNILGNVLFGPTGSLLARLASGGTPSRMPSGTRVSVPTPKNLPPTQERASQIVREKLLPRVGGKPAEVSGVGPEVSGSYLGKRMVAEKAALEPARANLQEKFARAAAATQRLAQQTQAQYGMSPLEQALLTRAAYILQAGK